MQHALDMSKTETDVYAMLEEALRGSVPRLDVDLTCERCPLVAKECGERNAPASVRERARTIAGRERAIAQLLRKGADPDRIARP